VQDFASIRNSVYWLLGTVAVFLMVAKIVGAENVLEPSRYAPIADGTYGAEREGRPTRLWPANRPEPSLMFSSNDKSRWATIRALVDEGTYVVGKRKNYTDTDGPFTDTGIIFEPDYQSLDKVMNPATGEFYSSKPPLLATVLAGEYWVLKKVLGWGIVKDRWLVMCTILLTINVIPFAIALVLFARLIEQYGRTDFGKLFTFTLFALGTFVMTFSHTLNNHSPAVYCVVFLVYPLLRIGATESRGALWTSGFFAGLLATLELPAAALTAAVFLPLLYLRTVRTLSSFLPAMLIPVAVLFLCNYAALGKLLPAYSDFGGPWYDYPGSHWKKWELVKAGQFVPGIDFNQESTPVYAFHLSLGHHGWFSLTPAFFVGLIGLIMLAKQSGGDVVKQLGRAIAPTDNVHSFRMMGTITLVVSVTVFAFYLSRTQSYNYGGNTSGPRWLFWLIPLWCLGVLPAADWLGSRRWGRITCLILLGFSVLSVYYPAWNPWRSPWIMQLCERAGWVNYEVPTKTQPLRPKESD
jgi:hypothetical protein